MWNSGTVRFWLRIQNIVYKTLTDIADKCFYGLKKTTITFNAEKENTTPTGSYNRVAIFYLTQYAKTRGNIPNYHTITKWP
jgi:hypothetical protein